MPGSAERATSAPRRRSIRSTAGVAAGLEPPEALAAATWRGGELLGEPEAGTIREGGPADFFLVHGDPLSDPTTLWRVWRVAWA
jgi:imidazolonepropionase-like amidohydrolase